MTSPMAHPYYFYDPIASFGEGSSGRRQKRLIDESGEPHLGFDAWQVGARAYDILRTEGGQPATLADLRSIESAGQALVLDGFFGHLNELASTGSFALLERESLRPINFPVNCREAAWAWQVDTMFRYLRAVESELEGRDLVELPCGESIGALALVAVFHVLDEAVCRSREGDEARVVERVLSATWLLDQVERREEVKNAGNAFARQIDRRRASERAKMRHARDPKRAAREFAKECWRDWRRKPAQYPSLAAFARAMLEKQPDLLKSEAVIARWVRGWDKEAVKSQSAERE